MENKIKIGCLEEIDRAAEEFIERIGERKLVAFYAPLGAGKTTFTAALCKRLGVTEVVNSPTFTILNEYRTDGGESIYHFDFYRIKNLREAEDIGLDDYLYSGCLCLMEWPENVEELLPEETLRVRLIVNEDMSRELVWEE